LRPCPIAVKADATNRHSGSSGFFDLGRTAVVGLLQSLPRCRRDKTNRIPNWISFRRQDRKYQVNIRSNLVNTIQKLYLFAQPLFSKAAKLVGTSGKNQCCDLSTL